MNLGSCCALSPFHESNAMMRSHRLLDAVPLRGYLRSQVCGQARNCLHTLSFEQYGDKSAPKTAIFIHGMLGNKKNMRTPCREFIKSNPDYNCLTIDLRGHGESHNLGGVASIEECAHDLQKLIQSQSITCPDMIVAHSLAGKVALKYLQMLTTVNAPLPQNTWILDSLPGPYNTGHGDSPANDPHGVSSVVNALDQLPMPQPSRAVVMSKLTGLGIPLSIAQWLGTSLQPAPDDGVGVTWLFDLQVAKQLFSNFVDLDMRGFLENYTGKGVIHFVRAGRSDRWTGDTLAFFDKVIRAQKEQVGGHKNLQLHVMPSAGHWLHSEDLHGLLKIINSSNVERSNRKDVVD